MTILPENFLIQNYGLRARLINEEDAPFIVSLRSDRERTKYMVTLDDDVEKQKSWIRDYKSRERKGEDYYFLYSNENNEPISISRISKIDFSKEEAKGGGWIKKRGPRLEAISIFMLIMDIAFEEVGLSFFYFDVHKRNKAAFAIFREFYFPFSSFYEKNNFFHLKCFYKQHPRAKEIFKEKYQ